MTIDASARSFVVQKLTSPPNQEAAAWSEPLALHLPDCAVEPDDAEEHEAPSPLALAVALKFAGDECRLLGRSFEAPIALQNAE